MSISSEITRISDNVSSALDAVESKGVTIPTGANSDDLPALISSIRTGSSVVVTPTLLTGTDIASISVDGSSTTLYAPTPPTASSATPQDLGTASSGSSTDYSRADHVHAKPSYSKSDVGLGNVDNVQQYSASNPPPYPVTSVNGETGEVTLTASDVNAIPAPASASSDNVLAYNGSAWVPDKRTVILSYGHSTWPQFLSAYNSNAVIYCRASSSSNPASGSQTRMAFMAYVNNADNPTNVEFQYYRSVNQHSATQQGDQVYVYKLDYTAGWTVTVRENYTKIVAGSGLSSAYSNSTITLTNSAAVPSGGTAGQVLTKNSSGYGWADASGLVDSVNGQTGDVVLDYSDVGAMPDTYTAPVTSVNNKTGAVTLTASDVGAGTYSKPSGGIPESDLASAVQTSLGLADTAYQKPSSGIPATDIADGVIPTVPSASSTTPSDLGTAAVGTGTTWARADHVHNYPDIVHVGSTAPTDSNIELWLDNSSGGGSIVSSVDGKTGVVTVLPSGGTTGQVLKKVSNTSYDVAWANESGGGGGGAVDSVNGQTGTVVLSIPTDTGDLTNNAGFVNAAGAAAAAPVQSVNGQTGAVTVVEDDHKWNDVALSKSASAGYSGYVPFLADTNSTTASLRQMSTSPSSGTVAVFDSSNYLYSTTPSSNDNSTKVATTAYVDSAIDDLPEPMVFKGSLGTGGTITTLPAASSSNTGFTYKVITAGTYASQAAKVGDTFISDGTAWVLIPSGDEPSGTVTSVGVSNATNGGLSVSGSPVTSSGTISIGHSNVLTSAQTTQAVYPIKIDKNGHISAYGTAVSIPQASTTTPANLGTAAVGTSTTWAKADHVHKMPSASDVGALPSSTAIPVASSATPKALGTAAVGTSTKYSREDHIHAKPTYSKSDVGLGNVANVLQYSSSNPPPYPVTKVNNKTGAVSLTASDVSAVQKSTLLWTNSSPNAEFASQKVSLTLTSYDAVKIIFYPFSGTDPTVGVVEIPVGKSGNLFYMYLNTTTTSSAIAFLNGTSRTCSVATDGVTFSTGQMIYNNGVYTSWNNRSIPWKIYGVHW